MAYVQDPNDQGMQGAQAPTQSPLNQMPATSTGGGTAPVTSSGAGSPQGAAAVPNTTKAPPVQNLQAYLTANAPQSVQMGQNIANNLTSQANKVTGDINADQAAFDQQVQSSNTAPNQDLVSRAAASPTDFVQNPDDVAAFQAQENANYTGPDSFESSTYAPALNTEVANAQQLAPDLTKPGAVQQLARGQEQNPTTGMSNLDSLLLQETPEALTPITAAEKPFATLGTALSNAATTENANIGTAKANDIASAALVPSAFTTGPNAVVPAWQKGLQDELATDTAQTNAYDTALNSLISSENSAQPNIAALEAALGAYNTTAPGYSSSDPFIKGATSTLPTINGVDFALNNPSAINAPTLDQAATAKDVEMQNALQTLLGKGFSPQFDASQAGKFTAPTAPPTVASLLNPALTTLGAGLDTAANAYTANGILAPTGTPANQILEGTFANDRGSGDLPAGYSIVPQPIVPAHGTPTPEQAAITKAIKDGTAIKIGEDETGQQFYAMPGSIGGAPETSAGNQSFSIGPGIHGMPGSAKVAPTKYATAPSQYTDLQKAYQTLQDYLAKQGAS